MSKAWQLPSIQRRSLLLGSLGAAAAAGLTACGGGGTSTPTAGGTTSAAGGTDGYAAGSSALKHQLGAEIEGVLYPEGYIGPKARTYEPFSDGSKTYRVVARSFPNQNVDGNNTFSKYLETATGVKVDYEIVPVGEDGTPKLNAMISSGDLPDAFMTGPLWMGGFSRSQIWAYGQQGMFLPLDQLIDENAPELMSLFEQVPELRKVMTAPDGKLYMIPSINQCYHCKSADQRTWVHGPSAEKVGMPENGPDTLEDFEAMLREFKGMGLVPMSGWIDLPPMGLIEAAYLNTGTDRLRRLDGAISYTPVEELYREALITTNRLVKEGLIDKNGFSQTTEQYKRLGMDAAGSKVAVVTGRAQSDFTDVDFTDPNARYREFLPIQPFKGPDGKAHVAWTYDPGQVVGLILTNKTQDPVEMIRWADYQMSLVSTMSMRLGVLGTHWDWAAEGETGIDGRQAIYKKTDKPQADNDVWWEMGPYNLIMDVRHAELTDDATSYEPMLYRAGKLYEPSAAPEEEFFMEPFFTIEQASQIGELRVNINNAFTQGRVNMALGNLDPNKDADWDSYVKTIKSAGLDQYLELLKAADGA